MPNHCWNSLVCEGKKEDIEDLKYQMFAEPIFFKDELLKWYEENNKKRNYIPYPFTKLEDISKRLYETMVKVPIDISQSEWFHLGNMIIDEPDDERYKENFDWYGWRRENWNTKWDTYDNDIFLNEDYEIGLNFYTAWDTPMEKIADELMEDYPDVNFTYEYDEPGCQFCGQFVYQDGESQWLSETSEPYEGKYGLCRWDLFGDEDFHYICENCGEANYYEFVEDGDHTCPHCGHDKFYDALAEERPKED